MHLADARSSRTLLGMHTRTPAPVTPGTDRGTAEDPPVTTGVALLLTSGLGNQVGAGVGSLAFPAIGPAGVVAMRQLVAAVVLLPLVRPPLRRLTWPQWWPMLLLAVVLSTMNLALYTAIDRIGLGLAVTLEFLGPLAVALVGSRGRRDAAIALTAAVGVYVLVLPSPSTDVLGVALALAAAACWAAYILLNALVGVRLPGLQGPAIATTVATVLYAPVLVAMVLGGRMTPRALAYGIVAGLLSSVLPYTIDLTVLRRLPARTFGVFMSIHPLLAALTGLVLLGQLLAVHELAGMLLVVVANVAAVLSSRRPALPPGRRTRPAATAGITSVARRARSGRRRSRDG